MTIIADGPQEVARFQAIVIKNALAMYRKTGMMANRSYTPKRMMAMAEKITGKRFKARDYLGAEEAITAILEAR